MKVSKSYRNKPLFRRQGDVRFKTGTEAAQLLVQEAKRRDDHNVEFIDSTTANLMCLAPIFDRNPKYAFAAKTLIEPERFIQFRVAWIDDTGVVRMNRGYRIQYSSSLGPYFGPLHFGYHVNDSVMKSLAFDSLFSNAVTGYDLGAAAGGSDFNPIDKSEGEMQRFCQSYMTELAKYVGPDQDFPTMGMGVGPEEMGYMYGQYKRINVKASASGKLFLSPEQSEVSLSHWLLRSCVTKSLFDTTVSSIVLLTYIATYYYIVISILQAPGYGVAHFANEMLKDKGDSLKGKRCLIIGSGRLARHLAAKLLQYGAIPLTFSDPSGHVYEPDGVSEGQLKVINKIKAERGALLGRYIISSTTAKFNDPESILDIPCDLCFPCGAMNEIDAAAVSKLADNGCQGVIEGGHSTVTASGRKKLKKRGMLHGPSNMTLTGSAVSHAIGMGATDEELAENVARIYQDVKSTATEFNARGDLFAGTNIRGFLRISNVMMTHGAV
jgi:glutamate dehydrogenase (NADP+)